MSILVRTRPGPLPYLFAALAISLPLVLLPAVADAAVTGSAPTHHCDVTWGSQAKTGNVVGQVPDSGGIGGVRAGRHTCYDRLVIDLQRPGASWNVRYVAAVTTVASGEVVPTAGGARLQIAVDADEYVVDAVTGEGRAIYRPADHSNLVPISGYRTFRQVTYGGSFESLHIVGLGVRARLPFRVMHLSGPGGGSRLVVDVAHTWS